MSSTVTSWSPDTNTKASETTSSALNNATLSGTLTVSGATQLNSTISVGVNDTGYDVKFFGATSGKYMEWDESADQLEVTGALDVTGNTSMVGTLTVGVDDTGHDVKFFGATSGQYLLWDESADELVLAGDSKLSFHDAAGGENIIATSDGHLEINAGTTLDITAPAVDLNGTLDVSGTSTLTGLVTATNGVKLGNNILYASDGDAAITTDTSSNVTIAGDLTVTGGDIDLSGEASQITLIDNTTSALQIGSTGALGLISINTNDDSEFVNFQHTQASNLASLKITSFVPLTGNVASSWAGGIRFDPGFTGNYTITNYSYLQFDSILLASSAAITNTSLFHFNAAAGSHGALDSGSAHPDIDTTDAWIKININGTIHYIPAYTDKS